METTGVAVVNGPLKEKLLKKFGVDEVMELLAAVYAPDSTSALPREGRVSSLCPIVFEAAFEDGDLLAINVVRDCAHKLAMQITAVLYISEQEVRILGILRVTRLTVSIGTPSQGPRRF
jgi:N-acetylglucosamine kinase-like BadF-type ATPase